MDIDDVLLQRRQIADEFRAKLTYLAVLRGRLATASPEKEKLSLRAAIDEGGSQCLDLERLPATAWVAQNCP